MATLKMIAEKTGFSVSVVSRALNPRPDSYARVAPQTRQLIEATALKSGFRRNRLAEFMRRGRSATIGVFLPAISNRLVSDLVFGISEILAAEDFPLQISFDMYAEGFRRFIQRNLDLAHSGIISYSGLIADPAIEKEVAAYRRRGGAVVLLNSSVRMAGVVVISMDEQYGGRQAGERLLARGCARFAVLGEFPGRQQGFQEALSSAGRTAEVFSCDAPGLAKLLAFCQGASVARPAGVLAVTDKTALRCMRMLFSSALRVGHEVLLVGYDDLDLTAEITPALTTVHQPFREEGRLAARKLLNMIYQQAESSAKIKPKLIIRESA